MQDRWEKWMGSHCTFSKFRAEDEWREARRKHISASDAACVIGMGFKTNVELWEEKTRTAKFKEPSKQIQILMQKGKEAESHIRELFAIDHDIEEIYDGTLVLCESKVHPFMSCTLDAWFIDSDGSPCILEIKRSEQKKMFTNTEYPMKYRAQMIHQMMVTGIRKSILCPYIHWKDSEGDSHTSINSYLISMDDPLVERDANILFEKEKMFWENVQGRRRPARIII